jgi:sulfatase maturation enzyme AslB (radical SAM superfamily)
MVFIKKYFIFRFLNDLIKAETTISEINLELVNYCNLRCKWCSLNHEQKKCDMSKELLTKFFDNLFSDRRFKSVKVLNLFNGGETLLHPQLIDMLKIIKTYKEKFIQSGLFFPRIRLLTNGMVLRNELARALLDLGILDRVQFSVDGGSRQKCEEIRKGGNR